MTEKNPSVRGDSHAILQAADHLRLLVETGLLLARERSVDDIVQASLNAGLKLSGAAFGVFVYDRLGGHSSRYQRCKVAGFQPENGLTSSLASIQLPPQITVEGKLLRSANVANDAAELGRALAALLPPSLSLQSLLALPVTSRSGEVLGAIFYGHPEVGAFSADAEALVSTIAAQAATAIDNARLTDTLVSEVAVADAARRLQRHTADRLEQVLDGMADGVALLDRDWIFTYLNRAGAEIIGPEVAVVGRHYVDVFPDQDARRNFELHYKRAMAGERVEFVDYFAPLDVWASVRAFPTSEGIAVFFQDVTQHRRAELALAESSRRLRQALDAGQLGTWTWDMETDRLDLDERAAELLFSEAHVPILRADLRREIVHPDDLHNTPDSLHEPIQTSGNYSAEYRVEGPDKTRRWIAARGIATYNEAHQFTGMVGTVQDVTSRITQEAVLRQSEKLAATGRLAATIAHEINNPLEAVTNLIYLCRTDPTAPAALQKLLEAADDELARVAQIAQQTLGFYRDTTRPADIDISSMLHGIVLLFARKLEFKRVSCRTYIQPGLRIFGLQGEIRQVFSNLLVNAIEASEETEIVVRACGRVSKGRPGISCLIADRGTGVPDAVRERLFSPFITSKQSVGTGLGLWVTRGIVEKHGGTIHYRTRTDPPTGTIFRVFLPTQLTDLANFNTPSPGILQ